MDHDKLMFKQEIQQMMYVAGETKDPTVETLAIVEEIIHQQVVQMLTTANTLANRRGSRVFSNHDIIFQFRHDTARVERLRTFLTWKSIRKTVKDSDEKDTLVDEAAIQDEAAGPSEGSSTGRSNIPTVFLPWDVESFFSERVPGDDDAMGCLTNKATIEKLRQNDEQTRDMTVAEYATWSEYRHASFTWRKTKRFREWSGLGVIADHRPADDVLDILGFLTTEIVQKLTAEALKVQQQELISREGYNGQGPVRRQATEGLFAQAGGVRQSVEAKHIRMAFQRLQARTSRHQYFRNSTNRSPPTGMKLL